MTGAAIAHVYRYAAASTLDLGVAPALRLATSGGSAEAPVFFRGRLAHPRLVALLLRGLSHVVGTRFHVPPAMLARILREADPVVTSGGGMLRFEGFSGCASAYARVDLGPDAYAGDVVSHGTTNVDFNAPMRAALAGVTDAHALSLSVGLDGLELARDGATIVERKVPLPLRWLKGFVEVQAYQARMTPRFELSGAEALRFLRALPRGATSRSEQWLVPSGRSFRIARTATRGAVRANGTERLRVLEELAPHAKAFRVFAEAEGQATAWVLDLGPSRFTLVTSADPWRGFSGEGQALDVLAKIDRDALVARTRAALRWQAILGPAELAASLGAARDEVNDALFVLGARGLVGFDLAEGAFFHRELPFDLSAIDALQPRLVAAKKLVAAGGIARAASRDDGLVELLVPGSDVVHRVRFAPPGARGADAADEARCTCPWYAKWEGARGPCKHVLAAQMVLAGEEEA